jgi:hypothetical protein
MGYSTGIRHELGIKLFPIYGGDPALRLASARADCKELKESTFIILTTAAPINTHTSVANLHLIYYHHNGSPINWIIVPPKHRQIFENKIQIAFNIEVDASSCSQFINHMCIWISPDILQEWAVDYYELTQKEGQMLIIFPGIYIWAISTGFGMVERKHYAGNAWKVDNRSFCSMQTALCRKANPGGVPVDLSEEGYQGELLKIHRNRASIH